jgi:hypothetical protein
MKNCFVPSAACLAHIRRIALLLLLIALAAPAVEAQIIYSNPSDITITWNGTPNTIYFDLNASGGSTLASTSSFTGADFTLSFIGDSGHQPWLHAIGENSGFAMIQPPASNMYTVPRLTLGESIPGSTYTPFSNGGDAILHIYSTWPANTTGYLALDLNNHTNYGWAQISYNSDGSLTLYDFAYNSTASQAIGAGAIPEPSTYAALAGLAALGFAAYRRRQNKAT